MREYLKLEFIDNDGLNDSYLDSFEQNPNWYILPMEQRTYPNCDGNNPTIGLFLDPEDNKWKLSENFDFPASCGINVLIRDGEVSVESHSETFGDNYYPEDDEDDFSSWFGGLFACTDNDGNLFFLYRNFMNNQYNDLAKGLLRDYPNIKDCIVLYMDGYHSANIPEDYIYDTPDYLENDWLLLTKDNVNSYRFKDDYSSGLYFTLKKEYTNPIFSSFVDMGQLEMDPVNFLIENNIDYIYPLLSSLNIPFEFDDGEFSKPIFYNPSEKTFSFDYIDDSQEIFYCPLFINVEGMDQDEDQAIFLLKNGNVPDYLLDSYEDENKLGWFVSNLLSYHNGFLPLSIDKNGKGTFFNLFDEQVIQEIYEENNGIITNEMVQNWFFKHTIDPYNVIIVDIGWNEGEFYNKIYTKDIIEGISNLSSPFFLAFEKDPSKGPKLICWRNR